MAMTAAAMANLIVTNLKTLNPEITGDAETKLTDSWTHICGGIISHIVAEALVTVVGTAAVTSAPGDAPVTGTGTIT